MVGAAIIVFGGTGATVNIILPETGKKQVTYNEIRADLTGKIVLGLDFFIAGDILTTVLNPSMSDLFTLRGGCGYQDNSLIFSIQRKPIAGASNNNGATIRSSFCP
jgi:glycerol uptake facilitator-like aquaporin